MSAFFTGCKRSSIFGCKKTAVNIQNDMVKKGGEGEEKQTYKPSSYSRWKNHNETIKEPT